MGLYTLGFLRGRRCDDPLPERNEESAGADQDEEKASGRDKSQRACRTGRTHREPDRADKGYNE